MLFRELQPVEKRLLMYCLDNAIIIWLNVDASELIFITYKIFQYVLK